MHAKVNLGIGCTRCLATKSVALTETKLKKKYLEALTRNHVNTTYAKA